MTPFISKVITYKEMKVMASKILLHVQITVDKDLSNQLFSDIGTLTEDWSIKGDKNLIFQMCLFDIVVTT